MMNDQEHKRNNDKKISGGTQLLSGKQIQSVQRAIDILNCFNLTNTELTLGQISTRLGLNKGTVHGILNTLHMNGYISQNSSGEYLLGAELFNKASLASDTKRSILIDRSHNYMQNLSDYFQGNCTLFRIDELYLQLIHSTEPHNSTFVVRRANSNMPLYCSASGKLVLAHLRERPLNIYLKDAPFPAYTAATRTTVEALQNEFQKIRAEGFSYENGELFEGVGALSVPIYSSKDNHLFATLSLTGMSVTIARRKKDIYPKLAEVARRLQQTIDF
jgi:hypothetical protein